jgi:hypothetical protein
MAATANEMTAGQRLETAEQASQPRTDNPEAEVARLRADIALTRAEIGSTLGALQEKLSPAAIAEQARSAVREATIGKVENMVHTAESTIKGTSHSLGDTIRRHPFSAALAGIGLAWLLSRRRSEERRYYRRGERELGPGERYARGED